MRSRQQVWSRWKQTQDTTNLLKFLCFAKENIVKHTMSLNCRRTGHNQFVSWKRLQCSKKMITVYQFTEIQSKHVICPWPTSYLELFRIFGTIMQLHKERWRWSAMKAIRQVWMPLTSEAHCGDKSK